MLARSPSSLHAKGNKVFTSSMPQQFVIQSASNLSQQLLAKRNIRQSLDNLLLQSKARNKAVVSTQKLAPDLKVVWPSLLQSTIDLSQKRNKVRKSLRSWRKSGSSTICSSIQRRGRITGQQFDFESVSGESEIRLLQSGLGHRILKLALSSWLQGIQDLRGNSLKFLASVQNTCLQSA